MSDATLDLPAPDIQPGQTRPKIKPNLASLWLGANPIKLGEVAETACEVRSDTPLVFAMLRAMDSNDLVVAAFTKGGAQLIAQQLHEAASKIPDAQARQLLERLDGQPWPEDSPMTLSPLPVPEKRELTFWQRARRKFRSIWVAVRWG